MKLAVAPVVEAGFAVGAVGPVVEAEEGARPVGSLEQQVLPGDLCVVVAAEGTVPDVVFDGFVDVADQAVVEGKASGGREVAFGDTEGHVYPAEVSPFGDDKTVFQDHARRAAALFGWAFQAVLGFTAEARQDGEAEVALAGIFIGFREIDGAGEGVGVKAGGGRSAVVPFGRRGEVLGGQGRRTQGEEQE